MAVSRQASMSSFSLRSLFFGNLQHAEPPGEQDDATGEGGEVDVIYHGALVTGELEAEDAHDVASHIRDMLVIYEASPAVDEEEAERQGASLGPFQKSIHKIVVGWRFEYFFGALICFDTVCSAIETDNTNENTSDFLMTVLTLNTFCFTMELVLRGLAEPWKMSEILFLFDTCIVLASVADVVSRLINSSGKTRSVHGLRVLRLMRAFRLIKVIRLPPLRLLITALQKSIQPLFVVLTLCSLLIFAFAVMMTNLVPEVFDDDADVRATALEYYGSVARSARTFFEVVDGSGSCISNSTLVLFASARSGKVGSIIMITGRIFAAFVLYLAFSGLVTGIFVEQLFGVHRRMQEREQWQELVKRHECLKLLDQAFIQSNFHSDDTITWQDIEKALETNSDIMEKLDISMQDARRLFLHLGAETDGSVVVDEFIFGVFKLKTVSKNIDTLSIDYQQEKTLQRLTHFKRTLRISIAGIQSRLSSLATVLPLMEAKVREVTNGIDEVAQLEEALVQARRRRDNEERGASNPEDAMTFALSVDMLRSNHQLHERLTSLEGELARLQLPVAGGPAELDSAAINAIADDMVRSIKLALQEELSAAVMALPPTSGR